MRAAVERLVGQIDIVTMTMWAISLLSTLAERALLLTAAATLIGLSIVVSNRFGDRRSRVLLPAMSAGAVFLGLYLLFPFDEYPFPVDGYLFPGNHPIAVALVLASLVGLERLTATRQNAAERGVRRWFGRIVSLVIIPGVAVMLLNGWALRPLARFLHADSSVVRLASGDFNGLQIAAQKGRLFASGHGTDHILAFDLSAPDAPPRKSPVSEGSAQSFGYNSTDDEIYVYNVTNSKLLFLDADSLALKRTTEGIGIAPGDIWVDWEPTTGTILLSSESDEDGDSTVAVDRSTGKVLHIIDETLANTLVHPQKPIYYMGLAERVSAFDVETRQVIARFDPGGNWFMERMAMSPGERDLLVAATADSAILKLDPQTLELRGSIGTVLGVRTLAVDAEHHLLFTASLVSNMLDVIDLDTEKSVARYYVGPWLRTIALDPQRGQAYVSSIDGLYKVDYQRLMR